jgi:hypothetical protein
MIYLKRPWYQETWSRNCSFASYYFGTWNKMSCFRKMIHHHQDGVITIRRWKVHDKVHGNWKQLGCRDRQWLKETMKVMKRIICSNINIIRSNKLPHIFPKLWSLIVSKHEIHGLVESKMACTNVLCLVSNFLNYARPSIT